MLDGRPRIATIQRYPRTRSAIGPVILTMRHLSEGLNKISTALALQSKGRRVCRAAEVS